MDTVVTQAKEDAAVTLARNVVNVKYEDIPAEALEIGKKDILDNLACTIGGSTAPGCGELVEMIKDWGGKEESTILAYGRRVPAPHAAQANASMCHALDYDDTHDQIGFHPAVAVVSTCFALAERRGGVSGKELLAAVTLGMDVSCRMVLAVKTRPDLGLGPWAGFDHNPISSYFGATAAAGKVLGLNEEKIVDAFGIAYAQAAGNVQCIYDGALSKRMSPAFGARGGIVSALMAEKGITGAKRSLEGKAGLYNVYHGGEYYPEVLTRGLGKSFEGANTSFKPWPSCRGNHPFIEATLALRKEHALKPEEVAEIIVTTGETMQNLQFEPLEIKRNPRTIVDAQFGGPWVVATALVRGKVGIEDFTDEAIKDSAILQVAQKVSCKVDASFTKGVIEPAIVEIKAYDGRLLSKRVDFPYGSPQNPISWETIVDKLWECAAYAVKPIPKENLEKVVELVRNLEELQDVGSVVRLLG